MARGQQPCGNMKVNKIEIGLVESGEYAGMYYVDAHEANGNTQTVCLETNLETLIDDFLKLDIKFTNKNLKIN